MSVILQKDKITGETLVYETTNYRDKKTGKSGTRKELLGKLTTNSQTNSQAKPQAHAHADDYETAVKLFDEAPHVLEDMEALTEKSFASTRAVGEMLDKKEGDNFSREEIIALFSRFSEVLDDKDVIFDKMSSFMKELINKAAYVVRENEFYKQDLETVRKGMNKDELNSTWMAEQIKTYEKLEQNNEKSREISQKLIAAQKDCLETYRERTADADKLIEAQKQMIDRQSKYINKNEKLLRNQDKIICTLLDILSKYDDVSEWDDVKKACEEELALGDEPITEDE
ncbi:MAG: hypothetical protein LUD50_02025 [Clostridia bacterium]|nr:hypothetical protein [Clostridia bacterium]